MTNKMEKQAIAPAAAHPQGQVVENLPEFLQQVMQNPTEVGEALETRKKGIHRLSLMLAVVFLGFVVWALFSSLDVMTLATGRIIPASGVHGVQHLEGGIIREVLVDDGQLVTQGTPLISLQSIASDADVAELNHRIVTLQADLVRYLAQAELAETLTYDAAFQTLHPGLVNEASKLFQAEKLALESALAAHRAQIVQKTQEREVIRTRLRYAKKGFKLLNERIAISEDLVKQTISNRFELLGLIQEATRLEGSIHESRAALEREAAAIEQARKELLRIKRQFQAQARSQLLEKNSQLQEFQERLRKFRDNQARRVIRAPVGGSIKPMPHISVGGVVSPGQTLMEIVPLDDTLIMEGRLLPQEIGYIHLNQSAVMTLNGPDAMQWGKIDGEVIYISPDTLLDEQGQPYFAVHIRPFSGHFKQQDKRYPLAPGVEVSAGVITDQRSVMAYLLSPFLRAHLFAFTER
ncbi:HlyD family type I secretion periplasmic adaptor subunit [Magnetococcus sp. PR-3]|uniref:HlyD family type I secretion periplasmic adaptor subunit n=1 Tax=Magnetococcus sp. PR-3 TaxID=3120355 RepID=UPI002FCE581A